MLMKTLAGLLAACSLTLAQAATPTHLYLLNSSYADELGGPALVPQGGTLGATGYSFDANQGLSLAGAMTASVYSIDLSFSFTDISGYRRLVDFLDLSSDTGLYVLGGALNFYNLTTGPDTPVVPNQTARLTVTRDVAGTFAGYINGVQQFAFADSSALAVFSGPSQIAHFFRDDNAVGGEASAGFVDYIRIYDVALSAAEVDGLLYPTAVPEPATAALLLAGGLWTLRRAARRR